MARTGHSRSVSLPRSDLLFGLERTRLASRLLVRLAASPNPFHGSVALRVAPAEPAVAAVGIYDVAGRAVAWLRPDIEHGVGRATWNGLTAEGKPVEPGVYYVRWRSGGDAVTARIVRR